MFWYMAMNIVGFIFAGAIELRAIVHKDHHFYAFYLLMHLLVLSGSVLFSDALEM